MMMACQSIPRMTQKEIVISLISIVSCGNDLQAIVRHFTKTETLNINFV